jgi:hypothetical protein
MTPDHIYVIQGLIALIVLIGGYILSRGLSRIDSLEIERGNFVTNKEFRSFKMVEFKDHSARIDKLRDKQELNTAEIYRHHDEKTEKVRDQIRDLETSLRTEMTTTNDLLTKLLVQQGANHA